MLTGNKDVDFLILNKLTDYELTRVCKVNTKVRSYCNNEEYWKLRTYQRFSPYISPLNPKDFVIDTWKNYYINIVKNIQEFNKGNIMVSDEGSIWEAIPKKFLPSIHKVGDKVIQGFLPRLPSIYKVGDDLKNILIKLQDKRKQYKSAIDNDDLKKVDELIHDKLIDVNYFISRMNANNAEVLIFLYKHDEKFSNINKKLVEEKLLEAAKNVVSAYKFRQVDDDYLKNLDAQYPEIGKLVKEKLNESTLPSLPNIETFI